MYLYIYINIYKKITDFHHVGIILILYYCLDEYPDHGNDMIQGIMIKVYR